MVGLSRESTSLSTIMRFMKALLVGLIMCLYVVVISAGCGGATDEGAMERIAIPTATLVIEDVSLGPLVLEGMYCWRDSVSGKQFLRFALSNPTDNPVRVTVVHGKITVRPQETREASMSDALEVGPGAECKYAWSILRSDSENAFLDADIEGEFTGTTLSDPLGEFQGLVDRIFIDLRNRDLAAIKTYLTPELTTQDIATLIAWRVGVDPVETQVKGCDVKLDANGPSSGHALQATSWSCDFSVVYVVYSPSPGSGTWNLKVRKDLL